MSDIFAVMPAKGYETAAKDIIACKDAEIDRLRAENLHCEHQMEISRNAIIEECARVVDELAKKNTSYIGINSLTHAAAAIRGLKDES